MALLKVTKLTLGLTPALTGGDVGAKVDYKDATTDPPTNGSFTASVPKADAENLTDLQDALQDKARDLGLPDIDWNL